MIFKRGKVYWYEFRYEGQRYSKSTRQRNYKAAVDIESARRTELAKGEAGLKRKLAPTLMEFEKTFIEWIEHDPENTDRTRSFYKTNFARLLEFKPFANARLSRIDEPLIERFKTKMLADGLSPTTVNRYLATLRKALRYASRKLRLFDRLPEIELYSHERRREFVFSDADYRSWLAIAPEPLRSASVLARQAGICCREMLMLQRDCVDLSDEPDDKGSYGNVEIRRGLKRNARRRTLPVTAAMRDVVRMLLSTSECDYLFTGVQDRTKPLSPWTLEDQLARTREVLKLDPDARLHALRNTYLTEMSKRTDPFTLQKIAGHASIVTTMKYVHPQRKAIEDAFADREEKQSLQNSLQ